MAQISPMRVKVSVDGPALRIAALQAATNTVQRHAFPASEGRYRNVILDRAAAFLEWLEADQEPQTLGSDDG